MIIEVEEIEAEVIKKDVRRINMRIYPDGKIKISVPKKVKTDEIELFIRERIKWIRKTKEKLLSGNKKRYLFDFEKDENVFLFGEEYKIETDTSLMPGVFQKENTLIIGTNGLSKENIALLFDEYFKKLLCEKLSIFVPKWEKITGLEASSWKVKKVKSYWGKCKVKTKELLFNQNLVHYPNECLEYVVLHELSHIRYPDHQKGFKDFLSKHMPDWKRISSILK